LATLKAELKKQNTFVSSLELKCKQMNQTLESAKQREHQMMGDKMDQEKKLALLNHELKETSRKVSDYFQTFPIMCKELILQFLLILILLPFKPSKHLFYSFAKKLPSIRKGFFSTQLRLTMNLKQSGSWRISTKTFGVNWTTSRTDAAEISRAYTRPPRNSPHWRGNSKKLNPNSRPSLKLLLSYARQMQSLPLL